jgi:hypothetical protein
MIDYSEIKFILSKDDKVLLDYLVNYMKLLQHDLLQDKNFFLRELKDLADELPEELHDIILQFIEASFCSSREHTVFDF